MRDPAKKPDLLPFCFISEKNLSKKALLPTSTGLYGTRINGRFVWRHADAINEFNREGLSLAVIDMEIGMATVVSSSPSWLEDDVASFTTRETADGRSVPIGNKVVVGRPYTCQQADSVAIQDGDAELAKIARAYPLSLLDAPVIQSALARWLYASWHGADVKVKKMAKELLTCAQAPKRGRKQQYEFNQQQLRQAYDDLVEYGDLLRKCHKKTRNNDELRHWFPDCDRLHEAGLMILEQQYIRQSGFPSPSTVAVRYIEYRTGMSPAKIHQLVDKVDQA